MYTCAVRPEIASLSAYVPGMSIAEVRERYGLSRVIKMASNENPLGVSPLVRKVLATSLEEAFRYPQGGNPALREALARAHHVSPERIVVGNGSDEIIDMLIRMLAVPGRHSVVCFEPCFSLYPIQARICGVETRRCPLSPDYSFDLDALFSLMDAGTRLVFVTTPDNPSGYCPPLTAMRRLAEQLERHFPRCLLVVDEAYMDFAGASCGDTSRFSLLASGDLPANVAILRTFSKSYGLAGCVWDTECCLPNWPGSTGGPGCRSRSTLLRKKPGWPCSGTANFAGQPWSAYAPDGAGWQKDCDFWDVMSGRVKQTSS